MTFRRVWRY